MTTESPKRRLHAVDAMKGVAITLVVFGHVLQGLMRRGWWNAPSAHHMEQFVYSFHVQAFFFASGLFVSQSIAHRGVSDFLRNKLRTLLYPYLVLNLIAIVLSPFIAHFQKQQVLTPWAGLVATFWGDTSWFLYALFFMLLIALALRRVPILIRLVLAVLLALFMPATGHGAIDGISMFYVFLVIGQFVGNKIADLDRIPVWIAWLGTILIFGFQAEVVLSYGLSDLPRLLFIPLGLLGTLGLVLGVRAVMGFRVERIGAWIGEASLGVFILHPYFQGITREFLTRIFATHHPVLQLFAQTLVATLVPALIYHQRKRLKLSLLFEWPEPAHTTS